MSRRIRQTWGLVNWEIAMAAGYFESQTPSPAVGDVRAVRESFDHGGRSKERLRRVDLLDWGSKAIARQPERQRRRYQAGHGQ